MITLVSQKLLDMRIIKLYSVHYISTYLLTPGITFVGK